MKHNNHKRLPSKLFKNERELVSLGVDLDRYYKEPEPLKRLLTDSQEAVSSGSTIGLLLKNYAVEMYGDTAVSIVSGVTQ